MRTSSKNRILFANGSVVLPDRVLSNGAVLCSNGRIEAVGPRAETAVSESVTSVDARGGFIAPGYVDIHVHGGGGADFMDGTVDAVLTATRAHVRHGTTTIFPTTTTGSPEQITAMLESVISARDQWEIRQGARIGGVHFYGPYFSEDKIGAHPKYGRRDPDPAEYNRAFDSDIIRVATCAAELPGAEAFYREAQRRGCLITCGHSNASWNEMAAAFKAGMRHVDHFWSAMSTVPSIRARLGTPVQGSMEQFVLAREEMSTELIADGEHLAPELLQFALDMKGVERLCLVTDANRAMDMPPGEYLIGPLVGGERFINNGKVGLMPDGLGLASSIMGMDVMVRNMARMTDAGVAKAIRMGSLTPAERVGVSANIGSLEAGKRADILLLDQDLAVKGVYIGGVEVPC